jgi:AraC-like DNA-binding protein
MSYREQPLPLPGATLWQREVGSAPERARILPDGCLDLVWDGSGLFVAGPDTAARWHLSSSDSTYTAVRFAGGLGPALLGLAAHEVRDQTPALAEVWSGYEARTLNERVARDPAAVLSSWVAVRATAVRVDTFGGTVAAFAAAGMPVAAVAGRLGVTPRQLHRRCLPVFGYGPRRLTRILRLGRALERARRGAALATVAAATGYADQAHLSREVRALTGATPGALLRELAGR